MPRHSWIDRLKARSESQPEVTGLVLSGGGARASFHIGALRYLYDRVGIAPTRIVGTSAGSIVSAMLSQSSDPVEQSARLRALEDIWLSMNDSSDMFAEQAWFKRLRSHADEFTGLTGILGAGENQEAGQVVNAQGDDADDATELVRRAMDEDPSHDMTLTASDMWQLAGSLLRVGRAGAGLAGAVRGAERANSAFRPGPVVKRLMFESGFKPSVVAESGVQLRLAFVDLNTGALRYMRQDGVIVDREDHPISSVRYDLTLGVWASCAIPGVFRPVKMGDGVYVDGGVRENVPVEMAVTHLGVTKPYVVSAAPAGVAHDDYSAKDLVSVLLRCGSIMFDETMQDEVEWARAAGAPVIQPITSVHDAGTVHPLLLRINRDYGWTRAAEETTGAPPSLREVDELIVKARCDLAADIRRGDATKDQLRDHRRRIAKAIARADPVLLPAGYEGWADEDLPPVAH